MTHVLVFVQGREKPVGRILNGYTGGLTGKGQDLLVLVADDEDSSFGWAKTTFTEPKSLQRMIFPIKIRHLECVIDDLDLHNFGLDRQRMIGSSNESSAIFGIVRLRCGWEIQQEDVLSAALHQDAVIPVMRGRLAFPSITVPVCKFEKFFDNDRFEAIDTERYVEEDA